MKNLWINECAKRSIKLRLSIFLGLKKIYLFQTSLRTAVLCCNKTHTYLFNKNMHFYANFLLFAHIKLKSISLRPIYVKRGNKCSQMRS